MTALIITLILNKMKQFFKSAFFYDLIIVLMFGATTILCALANINHKGATAPTEFFAVVTLVFLIILPACNTSN